MDMDDETGIEAGEDTVELRGAAPGALQSAAWRRIEEERERRQLREALEDFADYDV